MVVLATAVEAVPVATLTVPGGRIGGNLVVPVGVVFVNANAAAAELPSGRLTTESDLCAMLVLSNNGFRPFNPPSLVPSSNPSASIDPFLAAF